MECDVYAHWRLGCPNCGSKVEVVKRVCFGPDPHNTYRCTSWTCGWSGRSGLAIGSPQVVHDDELHAGSPGSKE